MDERKVLLTRDELLTVVTALEEFRDLGLPELAARLNEALRPEFQAGDEFMLTAARTS